AGFEIHGVLGRGGMGIVYRAAQSSPRRDVALKVLQPGFVKSDAVRRFARETDVLGALAHPGIATIHSAGTFDTGFGELPYFAMELVDGEPLDQFAESRKLGVHARCELVARVADAMQHAHERGVVHRDLKPANILVEEIDGVAQPRVLDFGIARCGEGANAGEDLTLTRTGQLFGTLPYMSPEQLEGGANDVDGRTDVYSLGAVLYELLSGRVPLEVDGQPLTEALRIIRETRPAALTNGPQAVPRDLTTIAQCALAKDPADRYPTAAALASDLRCFLEHRPIMAKRPGAWRRLRMYVRRNRVLVGGAAATIAVLSAGLVSTAILAKQNERLAENEASARRSSDRALYTAQVARAITFVDDPRFVGAIEPVVERWSSNSSPTSAHQGWELDFLRSVVTRTGRSGDPMSRVLDIAWSEERGLMVQADGGVSRMSPETLSEPETWIPATGIARFDLRFGLAPPVWADRQGRHRIGNRSLEDQFPIRSREHFQLSVDETVLALRNGATGCIEVHRSGEGRVLELPREPKLIDRFVMTPDGRRLAVAQEAQGVLEVWDLTRVERTAEINTGAPIELMAFSADGERLAAANAGSKVLIFRDNGLQLTELGESDEPPVSALAWSRDHLRLAVGRLQRQLKVYEFDQPHLPGVQVELRGQLDDLRALAFSEDGSELIGGGNEGGLRAWHLDSAFPIVKVWIPSVSGPDVHWSADGRYVFLGRIERLGLTIDTESNRIHERHQFGGGTAFNRTLELSIRETENGPMIFRRGEVDPLGNSPAPAFRVRWSPVDERLAVQEERRAYVHRGFDDAGPDVDLEPPHGDRFPVRVQWSRDGSKVAVAWRAGEGPCVTIHSASTGAIMSRCVGRPGEEARRILEWCPDDTRLLYGSEIVDVTTGEVVQALEGFGVGIESASWHPTEPRVALAGNGGFLLWDIEREELLAQLPEIRGAVAWSPDGNSLAVSTLEGPAWIWRAIR
ncbi:MAG: WD40 repeat domain-containing serine/threonine-protein kinase, partial [Planctomycetota bacterium]